VDFFVRVVAAGNPAEQVRLAANTRMILRKGIVVRLRVAG